jgi:hypothetical protein
VVAAIDDRAAQHVIDPLYVDILAVHAGLPAREPVVAEYHDSAPGEVRVDGHAVGLVLRNPRRPGR